MTWQPLTIGEALRRSAAQYPARDALIGETSKLNFEEFDQQVDALACGLLSIGIRRGDHVAVWLANTPEWVIVWMACARIGAVLVPINTRFKVTEAHYILQQSDARVLIFMESCWGIDFLGMFREMAPGLETMEREALSITDLPELQSAVLWGEVAPAGVFSLPEVCGLGCDPVVLEAAIAEVEVDDPVIIVYTSGTTGNPKGAVHSHVMLRNAENVGRVMHIESGDRILGHMPFYHIAGTLTAILPTVLLGCTLVTMSKWDPEVALTLIERERVNFFGGIPTHFIDCIDALSQQSFETSCLKSAWIGGAPVTPDVARAALDVMKLDALQAVYGMTETTSSTVLSEFEAPLELLCDNKGKVIGEFEVRVVDPKTGADSPVGEVGEVWVRGHIVMLEYYRNPEATRAVMTPAGFFRTGDLGVYDAEGYLKITGRMKDMFIVGGSNAYPAEIERLIQSHEGVKQTIVVGVPDARLGEVGYAFVQTADAASISEAELINFCRAHMADYKVPRYVEFVDDFPRTPTGKIQRFVLADQAKEAREENRLSG